MKNTNVILETENEMNYDVCINRSPEFFLAAQKREKAEEEGKKNELYE